MLQTQVMSEMNLVAQSLGVIDDKGFGAMLQTFGQPQAILHRNSVFSSRDAKEQNAMKIDMESMVQSLKRMYSIPNPQLPFTSLLTKVADSIIQEQHADMIDVSSLWNGSKKNIESQFGERFTERQE